VCACAGDLIAANATQNFLTRMQGWDYRLGINGVKCTQAAYNSALVAQGAFSAYWTEDIRAVGEWPDAIGDDIVLTWSLLDSRGVVAYEPMAFLDIGYVFFWIPGVILLIFEYPLLFSWWSMLVISVTLVIYRLLRHCRQISALAPAGAVQPGTCCLRGRRV
jgi:biofilm PGA synthesis N-glycosyltransferase PgaC